MSYIPRSMTSVPARAPGGRADEIQPAQNDPLGKAALAAAAAAALQHSFGPNAVNRDSHNGFYTLPSSTRASLTTTQTVESPHEVHPPMPVAPISAAHAHTNVLPRNSHRRSRSMKHAPGSGTVSVPAGADNAHLRAQPTPLQSMEAEKPQSSKSGLGLPSLKSAWPRNRQYSRPKSVVGAPKTEERKWTTDEIEALAEASLRYWKSGQTVDLAALSRDQCRSVRDISDMLGSMLQIDSKLGNAMYWVGEERSFIMAWAGAELPNLTTQSPAAGNSKSSKTRGSASRLESCFSVLACRPHRVQSSASSILIAGASGASAAMTARLGSPISGQNVVADFRETKDSHLNSKAASSRRASTEPGALLVDQIHSIANELRPSSTLKPRPENANMVASGAKHASGASHAHARSKSTASAQPGAAAAAEGDFAAFVGRSTALRPADEITPNAIAPAFTVGMSSQHRLNTLTRTSRERRSKRNSTRRATIQTSATSRAAPSVALPSSKPRCLPADELAADAVAADARDSGKEDRTAAGTSTPEGRTGHRMSHDSGNIEGATPVTVVSMLGEMGLSPEQSRYAIDVKAVDAEFEATSSNVPAEIRSYTKRFVDSFIRCYPGDFQRRIEKCKAGKDGLCHSIDNYAAFNYKSDVDYSVNKDLFKRGDDPTPITADVFFHFRFLRAISSTYPRFSDPEKACADDYAMAVFNQKIKEGHYIVFQEYTGLDGSGESALGGAADMFRELSGGERRKEQVEYTHFEKEKYMGKMALRNVKFYVDIHCDEFEERVRDHGIRPVPVALEVEEDKVLESDLQLRNLFVNYIWTDIPDSTLRSKEIAFLRSMELLNHEIVQKCRIKMPDFRLLVDESKNVDGSSDSDDEITDVSILKGLSPVRQSNALGRSFARTYFSASRVEFFEAMLEDHPFRPVSRSNLKVWMENDGSPAGVNIDYDLNVKLNRYVRQRLHIRLNDTQWLQTSAAATLSMIRRVKNALKEGRYLEHIDIEQYEALFKNIVKKARAGSDNSTSTGSGAAGNADQTTDVAKLRLSAFGTAPAWVSLISNPRPDAVKQDDSANNASASESLGSSAAGALSKSQRNMQVALTDTGSLPTSVVGPHTASTANTSAQQQTEQPIRQRRFSARDNIRLTAASSRQSAEISANGSSHSVREDSGSEGDQSRAYSAFVAPSMGGAYGEPLDNIAALATTPQPIIANRTAAGGVVAPASHESNGYAVPQQDPAQPEARYLPQVPQPHPPSLLSAPQHQQHQHQHHLQEMHFQVQPQPQPQPQVQHTTSQYGVSLKPQGYMAPLPANAYAGGHEGYSPQTPAYYQGRGSVHTQVAQGALVPQVQQAIRHQQQRHQHQHQHQRQYQHHHHHHQDAAPVAPSHAIVYHQGPIVPRPPNQVPDVASSAPAQQSNGDAQVGAMQQMDIQEWMRLTSENMTYLLKTIEQIKAEQSSRYD
ncbi:hypothetical protein GQ54DRAFT_32668 [Martensiomyces pterosporus]|nr:hypothetical protein GQ54DRAFT_32668 [Martensiomyces pterosporus]